MWQLENTTAHLTIRHLLATVDLLHPDRGIHAIKVFGAAAQHMELFSLPTLGDTGANADELTDHYVRSTDLVATYSQTAERNVSTQVYWRVLETDESQQAFGFELVVSAQTNLLDSTPSVELVSHVPCESVHRLHDRKRLHFDEIGLNAGEQRMFEAQLGESLFLMHLIGQPVAYAEMVYPTDFVCSELVRCETSAARIRLKHRLFPEHLEKGVIRRGRVRGMFLPHEGMSLGRIEQWAASCFDEFCDSAPPLTA